MLFKMAWTHSPEARDKTIKQFMETGGMPPENVELVSRYHNLDGTAASQFLRAQMLRHLQIMRWIGMA